MIDKKVSDKELRTARERYYEQKEACGLRILRLIGSLAVWAVGLAQHDPLIHCIVSVTVGFTMLAAFSPVLLPIVAKFNVFSLSTITAACATLASTILPSSSLKMPIFRPSKCYCEQISNYNGFLQRCHSKR